MGKIAGIFSGKDEDWFSALKGAGTKKPVSFFVGIGDAVNSAWKAAFKGITQGADLLGLKKKINAKFDTLKKPIEEQVKEEVEVKKGSKKKGEAKYGCFGLCVLAVGVAGSVI